ncbi:MAG: hypothetical protein ACRDF9_14210 [Candidatus Limnocylindria bacterium]
MTALIDVGRHVGVASLAGLVSGILVGGVLGRIVMRISGFAAGPNMVGVRTSNGNRVGDITLEGTLALVLFTGLASGVLGGVIYAVVEPWLRRARPWHGLAYGAALLLAFGFFVLDPSNFDFTRFGPAVLNVAMFAALFVIFGAMTAWLFDALSALRARTGAAARVVDVFAWAAVVPAVILGVLLMSSVAGLGDPVTTIMIVGPLLAAAIVRWRGLPEVFGYASLAVGVLLGAARTLSGIPPLIVGF